MEPTLGQATITSSSASARFEPTLHNEIKELKLTKVGGGRITVKM